MGYFDEMSVLVTGGTGSIGSAIVERLLTKNVACVVVLSRDASKQQELHERCGRDARLYFKVGDIRDKDTVEEAVWGANLVIHAAACKHIPACEESPREAVTINTLGSLNVLRASLREGVHTCLAISTDKACEPTSVMGMTKYLMERLFIQYGWGNMRTLCVRSGNVAGSQGSVIPLWKKQIASGGPVTITDIGMKRFFITVDKLVDLVFTAIKTGVAGEIFVPQMPEVRLVDLADVMRAGTACGVRITGARVGEKLRETVVSEQELRRTYGRGNYYVIGKEVLPEGFVLDKWWATEGEMRELL